jgi:hypothetical protein
MNMKRILSLVAFFATLQASAQQVNPVPDYVFSNRMSAGRNTVTDTAAYFSIGPRYGATRGMMPPMVVDTASFSGNKRNGLLIFSVQKNKFLYWDSVGVKWAEMAGTGGSAIAGTGTTNYLPKFTGTTTIGNSQVFDNGTNVGIGSTSPVSGLEIRRPGNSSHLAFTRSTSSGNANVRLGENILNLVFENNSATELARLNINGELLVGSAIDTGDYKLQITGNIYGSGTTILSRSSGNVGVGLLSPTGTTDKYINIFGTSSTELHLTNSGTGTGGSDGFTILQSGNDIYAYNYESGFIMFGTSGAERMRISSGGNVGIGVGATPVAGLEIQRPGSTDHLTFSRNTSAGNANIKIGGNTLALVFENNSSTELMRLNIGGELIISSTGTDAGDYKLQVVGNTLLNGNLRTAAPSGGTANDWRLGTVATVSPTSPNRTIEVSIGGTIYYIAAKTTND